MQGGQVERERKGKGEGAGVVGPRLVEEAIWQGDRQRDVAGEGGNERYKVSDPCNALFLSHAATFFHTT